MYYFIKCLDVLSMMFVILECILFGRNLKMLKILWRDISAIF